MTVKASADSSSLLMHFPPTDSATRVSRATVTKLAKQLGYDSDSNVLHYAALRLAREVLPTYEPDDGLPTEKQMAAIRKAGGVKGGGKVLSKLF
jgi:hypothetical protein